MTTALPAHLRRASDPKLRAVMITAPRNSAAEFGAPLWRPCRRTSCHRATRRSRSAFRLRSPSPAKFVRSRGSVRSPVRRVSRRAASHRERTAATISACLRPRQSQQRCRAIGTVRGTDLRCRRMPRAGRLAIHRNPISPACGARFRRRRSSLCFLSYVEFVFLRTRDSYSRTSFFVSACQA